ncbi:MAG: HD domain-containing protein [Thermoplasmatota archaeon]
MLEIRRKAELAVSRETLIHFTDHTIAHLDQVAANFIDLAEASRGTPKALNQFEYFVGLMACYLHDVALQATIDSAKDVSRVNAYDMVLQRNQHGEAASNWIQAQVRGESRGVDLGLSFDETVSKLALVAAPICKFHCSDLPSIEFEDKKLANQGIRVQLLLGLVRLADALHLDYNRVKMELLKEHKLPVESELHWWRHHYTDSVSIDDVGTIEIVMSFPKVSKTEIDLFKQLTFDYINNELSKFLKLFRQNGITATLLPISIDNSWGKAKQHPSHELSDFMAQKFGAEVPRYKSNPVPKLSRGKKKVGSFAYEKWGVEGHPWVDLPSSSASKGFVETSEITEYLAQLDTFVASGAGEMRMVYGGRGAGKTTLLNSIQERVAADADIIYLDMSLVFATIESPGKMYTWMFGRLVEALGDLGPPPSEGEVPLRLRDAMRSHDKPVVVLIDNLDRFVTQPDLAIVKRFFESAQGSIQDLKQKATIVITAHEDWKNFVKEEDLTYIGAAPSWNLNPMSADDIRKLMDRRLRISGSSYEKVFSPLAFKQIHRLAKGNPRQAIGDCAFLFESAIRYHRDRIDEDFIQEYRQTDLKHRVHSIVTSAAKDYPVVEKMLDHFSAFYDRVEQSSQSQDSSWELLESIYAGDSLPLTIVHEDVRPAFSKLTEMKSMGNSLVWKPSKQVLAGLQILKKEHELTREEFFAHFKNRPIRPAQGGSTISVNRVLKLSAEGTRLMRLADEADDRSRSAHTQKAQMRSVRYWVEYWLLIGIDSLKLGMPPDYEDHEHGVIKHGSKLLDKRAWKCQKDFKALISIYRNSPIHFSTLAAMHLVEANSAPTLRPGTPAYSKEGVDLLRLAGQSIAQEISQEISKKYA